MKFRDGVERDTEEYGYQVYTQRNLEAISKKKKVDPDYKKSLELVRECIQTPIAYVYRFKLKDLDIGEGFYTSEFEYVCSRVE